MTTKRELSVFWNFKTQNVQLILREKKSGDAIIVLRHQNQVVIGLMSEPKEWIVNAFKSDRLDISVFPETGNVSVIRPVDRQWDDGSVVTEGELIEGIKWVFINNSNSNR